MKDWVYLYCFFDARDSISPEKLFPGLQITTVKYDCVGAIVSPVEESQYNDEAVRLKLKNLNILAAEVQEHHHVVDKIAAASPVVPARFCTVIAARNIVEVIKGNYLHLWEFLDYVRDKEEWGVRVYADTETMKRNVWDCSQNLIRLQERLSSSPPGEAYFLRKRIDAVARENLELGAFRISQEVFDRLKEVAVEAKKNPLDAAEKGPAKERAVMNAAYLLLKKDIGQFKGLVNREAALRGKEGLSFILNGPWAPYNFSPQIEAKNNKIGAASP